MDWLEEELKQALVRKEPDPGFEERVRERRLVVRMPRPVQRWIGIAAAIVIAIGAGEAYRYQRGQEAKEQVMLAMKIAGGKLNRVQMQIQRGDR